MLKGYKYRPYPDRKQRKQIDRYIAGARFFYNWLIDQEDNYWKSYKDSNNKPDKNFVPTFRAQKKIVHDFSWLKDLPSNIIDYTAKNLKTAYKNWFRSLSKKDYQFRKPVKKTLKSRQSYGDRECTIDYKNKTIRISNIETPIKAYLDRRLPGSESLSKLKLAKKYKVTISRTPSRKYFFSVQYDDASIEPKTLSYNDNNAIGIDFGVKDYIITSSEVNGLTEKHKVEKLENLLNDLKKVKRLQRLFNRSRERYYLSFIQNYITKHGLKIHITELKGSKKKWFRLAKSLF